MNNLPVDSRRDAVPIRLFKSNFLEFFSHIHPLVIVCLWLPILVLLLEYSWQIRGRWYFWPEIHPPFPFYIPLGFLLGVFLWTFTEYLMHRFVFHHKPTSPWQERILFLFHGIHHAQPQVKTRLVMPLPVTIPLAFVFWGLFSLIFGTLLKLPNWVPPLMAGMIAGYLAYDLIHYATHHWAMRRGAAKFLKRYHMLHHYKDPATRFGVSSPLWDYVFGTTGEG